MHVSQSGGAVRQSRPLALDTHRLSIIDEATYRLPVLCFFRCVLRQADVVFLFVVCLLCAQGEAA